MVVVAEAFTHIAVQALDGIYGLDHLKIVRDNEIKRLQTKIGELVLQRACLAKVLDR